MCYRLIGVAVLSAAVLAGACACHEAQAAPGGASSYQQTPLQALAEAQAYQGREKTVLEQILNYTSFADENGYFSSVVSYWISGDSGEDQCILTRHQFVPGAPVTKNGIIEKIDLRQFNQNGFRFVYVNPIAGWRVGDENTWLMGSGRAVLERLQKAWGIAFEECPGKKSPF